jgi:predicted permease
VWAWRSSTGAGDGTSSARADGGRRSDRAAGGLHVRLRLRVALCFFDAITEALDGRKMTGMGNDLRYALRGLIRKPGFTAVAVVTLALGIGATTAVFTLLDGVLLSPLPYANPGQLVSLDHQGREGQDQLSMSPGLYVLYRDQSRTLESIALYVQTVGNVVVGGEPERVPGQAVTPSFFEVLGESAVRGRTFVSDEGQQGAEPVIVLSDGLWRTVFGGDAGVIGQTMDVNGITREIVGVMAPDFGFPDRDARFWVPFAVNDAQAPIAGFGANGIARMAPDQTLEGVRAELGGMLSRLPELVPGPGSEFLMQVQIKTRLATLKESLVGDLRTTLWILFATVGIVLLIACANVANLLLVRAEGRQRELALRVALGAGRLQLLRAFMGESTALAAAGATLGVVVAATAVRLTTGLIPTDLPRMAEIGIDGRVLAFTAAIAIACALFFGLFPMLRYGVTNLAHQLAGGTRGATAGREHHRVRNGLVVSQVALALVLLVGSGLMLRSFMALRSVHPGFDAANLLTARVTVPSAEIPEAEGTRQFFTQLRQQLEVQPGVEAVGMATAMPLGGSGVSYTTIEVEDHPRSENELPMFASWPQAGAGYFEAMGIPLLEGRTFRETDGGDGFRAVVVSRAYAERWWPGTSPIGRRMRLGAQDEDWYEIVGVVENVRQQQLEELSEEMVYFPLVTEAGGDVSMTRSLDIVIRTAGDPLTLVSVLRGRVRELNPRIPLSNVRTGEAVVGSATARTSFTASMLGAASGIALLLGLVGIYGVISYVVSQRTREIGVRMALGASRGSVRGMVVRQGLLLSLAGVVLGLIAAAPLSRLMRSLLYGVRPIDPLTYLAVGVSLIAVAVLASLIPAVRAAGVDPGSALRIE